MKRNTFKKFLVPVILATVLFFLPKYGGADAFKNFSEFCTGAFQAKGECPADICRLATETLEDKTEKQICVPVQCPEIDPKFCPEKYCARMTDCRQQEVCHYQMEGEKAKCGDLAYAGQDVACCKGLVKRCGIEFIDGTCDMEGIDSIYNLPICIPCGDKICSNFENRCNCPEDCGKPPETE